MTIAPPPQTSLPETEPRHYSEMTVHRRCPQQWMYRSLRRLQADIDIAPVRDFGSWWHALRAAYLIALGTAQDTIRYVPDRIEVFMDSEDWTFAPDTSLDAIIAAAGRWYDTVLTAEQREDWADTFKAPLDQGLESLLIRWEKRWAADLTHEQVLAVEMPWQRWLTAPEGSVLLEGTVDEIVYDPRRNMTMIRDGKTTKDLGQKSALEDMMDSQLMLYAWGVTPLIKSWGVPQIKAVSYDRCRSITPMPPQLTKSGRLAVRGGEPSINGTDLDTYLGWAQGPDGNGVLWGEDGEYFASGKRKGEPKFGYYTAEESVVERLSSPAAVNNWFQRTRTPLNPNIIRTHLRAALDSAADIDRTIERVAKYGYAQRNLTASCTYCVFVQLCRAEMIGGAGQFDLAEYGLRDRPPAVQR